MVNAAVPVEAYDGEKNNRRLMVHPDWKDVDDQASNDYEERLIAPNWSDLFPSDDRRSELKWKGRFAERPNDTVFINFYPTGEVSYQ